MIATTAITLPTIHSQLLGEEFLLRETTTREAGSEPSMVTLPSSMNQNWVAADQQAWVPSVGCLCFAKHNTAALGHSRLTTSARKSMPTRHYQQVRKAAG